MAKLSLSINAVKQDIDSDSPSQIKERVDAGFKIFEKNFATWGNLIHLCIYKSAWKCVDYLLCEHKTQAIRLFKESTDRRTTGFDMMLTTPAVGAKHEVIVNIINKLLSSGEFNVTNIDVSFDNTSADRYHPILIAIKTGELKLAKRLIDMGCPFDVNHKNLGYLLSKIAPSKEAIESLEGLGFSIQDIENPNSLFYSAVRQGAWNIAQLISDKCKNLSWKKENDYGYTLSDSVYMKDKPQDFVEFVKRFGSKMNSENRYGKHWLSSAIFYDQPEVAMAVEEFFPLERSEILTQFMIIHGKDKTICRLECMMNKFHWNFTNDDYDALKLPEERATEVSNNLHWAKEDKNKCFKYLAKRKVKQGDPKDYLDTIRSEKALKTYLSITEIDVITLMALTERKSIQAKLLEAML